MVHSEHLLVIFVFLLLNFLFECCMNRLFSQNACALSVMNLSDF